MKSDRIIIVFSIAFCLVFAYNLGKREGLDMCFATLKRIELAFDKVENKNQGRSIMASAEEIFEIQAKPDFERAVIDFLCAANEAGIDAADVLKTILHEADARVYAEVVGE